jgi:putative tryptophan/tyrosine transport system ATP-binding protein
MLRLKNIFVSFGKKQVLKDLSCTVEDGDFIVIVGTNGAGKSTFFDTIAGHILPTSGSVFIDSQDVTQLNELQRAHLVTRIFQDTKLNSVGSMTVAQNLAIAHYARRSIRLNNGMGSISETKLQEVITGIGMDKAILNQRMDSLSGGQRQLIAFAMSTQLTPRILLLDEPTAALDPQTSTTLLLHTTRFIKQHKVTTLLITHDPHIALSIGNKVWILQDGIITKQYTQQDKATLDPESLIGQIDYLQLSKEN